MSKPDNSDAVWWREKAESHLQRWGDTKVENIRLREALAFYADPETYEQVDVLGCCGLSEDKDSDGNYGLRARAALNANA